MGLGLLALPVFYHFYFVTNDLKVSDIVQTERDMPAVFVNSAPFLCEDVAAYNRPNRPDSCCLKIAYVNSDTLDEKSDWLNTQRRKLGRRIADAENLLKKKRQVLAQEMIALQKMTDEGATPPAELEKEQDNLLKLQEMFNSEEEQFLSVKAAEQDRITRTFAAHLSKELQELKSRFGYDYILSYSREKGPVLLVNESFDITRQVLDLLNEKKY